MNPIVKQYINYKINNFSAEDLYRLSKVYELKLTKDQSKKVIYILRQEKVDIGNQIQINHLLKQIGSNVGKEIEIKIRYLLKTLLWLDVDMK